MVARPDALTDSRHSVAGFGRRNKLKKRAGKQFLFWLCIGVPISLYLQSYLRNKNSDVVQTTRKLMDSSDCASYPEWIEKGGVVLYLIGTCYLFVGIYIVCEDYFVESLEEISTRLELSKDVAGATFMAAGSSAPELFTSLVALTNDNASNDIGVGTIVGSAVFNILVIVGVSAVFSGRKLNLDYRPLLRDGLFYAIAIVGVLGAFFDGKIYWWEGLIFVMMYGVYILAMRYNETIMDVLPLPRSTFERFNAIGVDLDALPYELVEAATSNEETSNGRRVNRDTIPLLPTTSGETSTKNTTIPEQDIQEDDQNPFSMYESTKERLFWFVSLPWNVAFYYTVPDCSKENLKKWYMLTFTSSIIWIGVISWFMVEWAADIGCVLRIPSEIMGVTILAAGTSIPDALASIKVAQDGEGDMAVANAVGSNIFDIWLGLGLPWLLVIPFTGEASSHGKYIEVDKDELLLSVGILFGVLVFYLLCIMVSRWRIDKRHGYVFTSLYFTYALYYIIVQWAIDV